MVFPNGYFQWIQYQYMAKRSCASFIVFWLHTFNIRLPEGQDALFLYFHQQRETRQIVHLRSYWQFLVFARTFEASFCTITLICTWMQAISCNFSTICKAYRYWIGQVLVSIFNFTGKDCDYQAINVSLVGIQCQIRRLIFFTPFTNPVISSLQNIRPSGYKVKG